MFEPNSLEAQILFAHLSDMFDKASEDLLALYTAAKQAHEQAGASSNHEEAWDRLREIPENSWPAFIVHLIHQIYELKEQAKGSRGS